MSTTSGGADRGVEPGPAVSAGPRIRAAYMKLLLEESAELPPRERDPFLREVDAAALEAVTAARKADWLAEEVPSAFAAAAMRVLGPERTRGLYRGATLRSFRSSLPASILAAAIRLLDSSPARLLRGTPRGFAGVWRGCGALVPAASPEGATILHRDVPASLMVPAFHSTVAASLEAIPQACGHTAVATITVLSPSLVRYDLRW